MSTTPPLPPASSPATWEAWLAAANGDPSRYATNRASLATAVNAATSPDTLWNTLQNSRFLSLLVPITFPANDAVFLHSVGTVGDSLLSERVEHVALSGFDTTPAPIALDSRKLITPSRPLHVPSLADLLKASDPAALFY